MEASLWRLLISSQSDCKYGHHRQFLFVIGRFLRNLLHYKDCSFRPDAITNMAAISHSCFWLIILVFNAFEKTRCPSQHFLTHNLWGNWISACFQKSQTRLNPWPYCTRMVFGLSHTKLKYIICSRKPRQPSPQCFVFNKRTWEN